MDVAGDEDNVIACRASLFDRGQCVPSGRTQRERERQRIPRVPGDATATPASAHESGHVTNAFSPAHFEVLHRYILVRAQTVIASVGWGRGGPAGALLLTVRVPEVPLLSTPLT